MAARRDGLARREALLDAALTCFAERGVASTGIEEIRREAGASPSSVYHHFRGREDLLLALLTRTFGRLFSELSSSTTRTRTAKGFVHAVVRGHLQWVLAHRAEARVMYQAMSLELGSAVAEPLQRAKADLLAPLVAHAARFIERGELPRWDAMQFDVVALGSAHESCRRFLAGAPLDPDWMLAQLPRLAWRSISAATTKR